jgi:hypothetical protein
MSSRIPLLMTALCIGLSLVPSLAFSETRQVTVPHGKPWGLVSIGAYDRILCGSYPVHNVRIATAPAHGTAQVIEHMVPLGKDTGVCAGKSFKAPVVVYKPAGNYSGADRLTVTWTAPKNTQSVSESPNSLDIEITVK